MKQSADLNDPDLDLDDDDSDDDLEDFNKLKMKQEVKAHKAAAKGGVSSL